MSTKTSHVALTNCFFCGEPDRIILHRMMGDVSKLHGKVLDYEPCPKCADYMKQGVIVITVKDDDSEYRTGGWFVLRDAAIERMIAPSEQRNAVLRKRCVMISHSVAEKFGLFAATPSTPTGV